MGVIAIVTMLGVVAVGTVFRVGHRVRRELIRRRQVARVRAALEPRPTVAELRERCGADLLPYYPTPAGAAGDPDPVASAGPTVGRAA